MTTLQASHVKKLAIQVGGNDVDNMLARQNLTGLSADVREIPAGAIGCLGGQALPQQGNALFFTGAPINGPDARDFTDADAAARPFPQFDGAFIGVFWDAQQQILVVATDCLGMQPLYMQETDGTLRLMSETKAVAGEPDLAAWGAFISIGHPIGNRSLAHGVKRVPPASVLVYDCARQQLTVDRYWEWPEPSDAWRSYDFLGALEAEIQAYAASGPTGTLLLSGGFDSRLLLFLLKRAQVPADALIVAHDDEHGDADGRLAERIAIATGTDYRKVRPPMDFFSSAEFLNYLVVSEVGHPSLDLFIAKVASQIDSEAVWDGLAPGHLFKPAHQPEGGFEAYLKQKISGPQSGIWRAAKFLFKPEVVEEMFEGFSGDLQAEVGSLPHDAYGVVRFVFENRARNRASMNPLKVYANRAVPFTPGLSKNVITHAASIPFREKQNGRFYLDLFSRLDQRSLKVPFLSGAKLIKPSRFNSMYYYERTRIEFNRYRTRYPSVFGRRAGAPRRRSMFLDNRLFEPGGGWLNPGVEEKMHAGGSNDYLAWKLLFHWKAWQWVHEERLGAMLK